MLHQLMMNWFVSSPVVATTPHQPSAHHTSQDPSSCELESAQLLQGPRSMLPPSASATQLPPSKDV